MSTTWSETIEIKRWVSDRMPLLDHYLCGNSCSIGIRAVNGEHHLGSKINQKACLNWQPARQAAVMWEMQSKRQTILFYFRTSARRWEWFIMTMTVKKSKKHISTKKHVSKNWKGCSKVWNGMQTCEVVEECIIRTLLLTLYVWRQKYGTFSSGIHHLRVVSRHGV